MRMVNRERSRTAGTLEDILTTVYFIKRRSKLIGKLLILINLFIGGVYFLRESDSSRLKERSEIEKVIAKKVGSGYFQSMEDGWDYYHKFWRFGGIVCVFFSLVLLVFVILTGGEDITIVL